MEERIFLSPPDMTGKELKYIKEVFDSNYIAPVGPMIKKFEDAFCEYTGFKYACAVSSGTAAIHLGLVALGVGVDENVITSTLTFIGGVYPILYEGAKPIFIDCDKYYTTSVRELDEAITKLKIWGNGPSAVILTDLYGQCCDMEHLLEICRKNDIPVLVDACESLGATAYGKHAGKGADVAAFSFNGNKIITTSGGGMVASDNKDLINMIRSMSQQSVEPGYQYYHHTKIGFNYRMSNVLAAIGLAQLEALDEKIGHKRAIFDYYSERLSKIPGILLMEEAPYGYSSRWQSVISLTSAYPRTPTELKFMLEEENIESRLVFRPMHNQPIFENEVRFSTYISDLLFWGGLCLPCGTSMLERDLDRVCKVIEDGYET